MATRFRSGLKASHPSRSVTVGEGRPARKPSPVPPHDGGAAVMPVVSPVAWAALFVMPRVRAPYPSGPSVTSVGVGAGVVAAGAVVVPATGPVAEGDGDGEAVQPA